MLEKLQNSLLCFAILSTPLLWTIHEAWALKLYVETSQLEYVGMTKNKSHFVVRYYSEDECKNKKGVTIKFERAYHHVILSKSKKGASIEHDDIEHLSEEQMPKNIHLVGFRPKKPKCPAKNLPKLDSKAWKLWLRKHPFKKLSTTHLSPNKQFRYSKKEHSDPKSVGTVLKIKILKKKKMLYQVRICKGCYEEMPSALFPTPRYSFFWTSDSRYFLIVEWLSGEKPEGTSYVEAEIKFIRLSRLKSLRLPKIKLLANKNSDRLRVKSIAQNIRKVGFATTRIYHTKVKRKKSVIYTKKGQRKVALTLASLVPGGAKIKTLNWKSRFTIILALGTSARGRVKKKVSIQLFANSGLSKQLIAKVVKKLRRAGFTLSTLRKSKVKRKTTNIYAAVGYEATARHIANLIPGGALVLRKRWKSKYHVVLAIGRSAR